MHDQYNSLLLNVFIHFVLVHHLSTSFADGLYYAVQVMERSDERYPEHSHDGDNISIIVSLHLELSLKSFI